jgi:hypothetical protein
MLTASKHMRTEQATSRKATLYRALALWSTVRSNLVLLTTSSPSSMSSESTILMAAPNRIEGPHAQATLVIT